MTSKKFLSPQFVSSMLSGHSALALAAGALLYILCLSGTVIMFHEEFVRWEQPAIHEFENYTPEFVEDAAKLALQELEGKQHHFNIMLPTAMVPRMVISAEEEKWYVGATGERSQRLKHPGSDFLHDLHFYLHLPKNAGLIVTGLLGAIMLGLVLSGILSHPKIFREAFSFRTKRSKRLALTDWHNRLSVWGLPFHLTISLSGALLGLASILAFFMASIMYNGDTAKVFEPIFGTELDGDKADAPLADISNALHALKAKSNIIEPWYVIFHDPETKGQTAELLAKHHGRLPYGETYTFNETGDITDELGLTSGPVGQQYVASVYQLHFGSYGGVMVKILYALLGISLCYIVVTGINIWLHKRREKGRPVARLERAWFAIIWGVPLSMAIVLFFEAAHLAEGISTLLFWGLLFVLITASSANEKLFTAVRYCQPLLPLILLGIVLIHLFKNPEAAYSVAAYGVNSGLLATAALLAFAYNRRSKNTIERQQA